jgi:CelD/BcsL family acetyltransferase involved in cellulose biosynthesis
VTVQIVKKWANLAGHSDAWTALLGQSATPEPTLSPLWLGPWWHIFGATEGRSLRTVLVHEGGRLIGLAPLLGRRIWYRGAVPIRRLELLASGERQDDEICSDYLNVLAERGKESQVARALIDALQGGALGDWDELILDAMNGRAAMTEHLIHELKDAGLVVDVRTRRPCPYAVLPATWQGYLDGLSSRHRYMVRRSARDLDQWAGDKVEVMRARTRAELEQGQEILARLHGHRWQEAGRQGVFASRRFRDFHSRVMPALLDRDQLDLMWLCCKGEPVAAIYNIVWNERVYFYQCGRRTDLPDTLRPGIVMHAHAMQRAIARGCKQYDFLSGASRYKKQLAADENPLVQVRALQPGSIAARVQRLAERGEVLARGLRRAWRERF